MPRCVESADEMVFGSSPTSTKSRTGWHLIGVVALGILTSACVWGLLRNREEQLLKSEFAARAQERTAAIAREVRDNVELVHAVVAFFAGSDRVERGDFQTFVGALTARARSVLAIEWAPRIPLDQRDAFERRLRQEVGTTIGIVEAGTNHQLRTAETRPVYFPIEYLIEPAGTQTGLLGFDRASDELHWETMQRSSETGGPVATSRLALYGPAGEEEDGAGILIAQPVFAKGLQGEPVASDEVSDRLLGFVIGVYRVSDIVRGALANFTNAGVHCRILDVTDPNRPEPLHLRIADPDETEDPLSEPSETLLYTTTIDVPGRRWVVECWPTQDFLVNQTSMLPAVALLVGLLGTGMLTTLIWLIDGRADAVERIVIERTAELRDANEKLEQEVQVRVAAESRLAEHARNLEESNRQLELARVELQRQATIDPLTNVLNRLSFGERFAATWSCACESDLPLSCVLLDIDFFKKINDTHGHPAGDAVLKSFAAMLCEHVRSEDCVARFGGEEFCVLLPGMAEPEALSWAEQLRKAIAAAPLQAGDETIHITASLGVATRTADVSGPEKLLDQADEALLVAKRQGRNRLVAFSELHRLANAALDAHHDVFRGACAADIMTPVLMHLAPSQSLPEAARVLLSLRLDSLPVIDEEGHTLGIIGEEDLTAQILSDQGWQQEVGDVMNTAPVTYEAGTPAVDICEFLSRVSVRRVIILQDGSPVGLISRSTIIRWLRNSLLSAADLALEPDESSASPEVAERLHSTIERLTLQIAALQQGVESSPGSVTPVVVSAATRIQELVDDALMLSAGKDSQNEGGYATMGAVLS